MVETGSVGRPEVDFPLGMSIGAQLRHTQRALLRSLQLRLAPHEMPVGTWYFLRVLWEEDGLSQREISERVGATAATATEQLHHLEARGLVTRTQSQEDRRRMHFSLTEAGRALKAELIVHPIQLERAALRGFSPAEVGALQLALGRIQENLAKHDAEDAATAKQGAADGG